MKITIFSLGLLMTSSLSAFNAQCAAVNVPYVDHFDAVDTTSGDEMPACATRQQVITDGPRWRFFYL